MSYPHVTGVLNVLRKIGLEYWFKNNTADFCNAESEKGRIVGKLIHGAIQSHIEKEKIEFETDYPEEVSNALRSFFKFKKEHPEFKLKKAELSIVSEKHKYCGTLDCLATEKKELVLFDYKTGTAKERDLPRIYPDSIYQISAYVKAYNEMAKGNIEKVCILCLAKDKIAYNFLPIFKAVWEEAFNEVFLPCLKIWQYQKNEGEQNGSKTRQRTYADPKTGRESSTKSDKLPSSF